MQLMTHKIYLKPTPQEIAQACSDLKSQGFGVANKLKGKNSVGGRYLRYAPEGFIDLLKANLYWDTRYLGGGHSSRGRTVVVFEGEAIVRLFEKLEIPSKYYSRPF